MEEICIGQIIELESDSSICIRFFNRPSMVASKKMLGNFNIGDFIICELKDEKKKIQVKKLHTFRDNQVGEIIFDNGEPVILFSFRKEGKIRIPCNYFPNLHEGAKVRFKLDCNELGLKAIIYQLLGEKEDTRIEIMDIAEQHGIPTVFSKQAMRQAKHTREPRKDYIDPGRTDLSKETIFTIDGTYSKDFDDAVSLKRDGSDYLLGVHIADVGYYIQEGSPLDLEARKRGMTAYLLNDVFPMFPKSISNGVCSLNEDVDRYTLSLEMRISKSGLIKDVRCFPALIHSKKRMTYDAANEVLSGRRVPGYREFSDVLYEMDTLADILYHSRIRNGAINFDNAEPNIELDHYGHVVDIGERKRGKAELLIQEFMLAANRSVADLLYENGLEFPHRIHRTPDMFKLDSMRKKFETLGVSIEPLFYVSEESKSMEFNRLLDEYRGHPNYHIISSMLISCMRRARYSLDDVGHFGLGLKRNVHFTSPIRRYPDLMIHRILKKNYLHNIHQSEVEIDEMRVIAEGCTSAEGRINKCEERVIRKKCREYLLSHVGETMDAVVKDCTDKGMLIEIKHCIEEMIPREELADSRYDASKCRYTFINSKFFYQIGDSLKVRLVRSKVSPESKVCFEIVNDEMNRSYVLSRHDLF